MSRPSPRPLEYEDYIARLQVEDAALAQQFASFHGIEQVLHWMQQQNLTQAACDIISQDEFSYDFLLQLNPGRWLAFGVT